jgi:uncharacterized protein (TIGR00297 family)
MDFLTLNLRGILLSFVIGGAMLAFGFWLGPFFIISMIVFLVLSAIVTYIGMRRKRRLGVGQKPRGVRNVLANGLPPLIIVLFYYVLSASGNQSVALLAVIGFLASVAAITADKFNSEIGVLNGNPRMIFTLRRVRKGTSGGITLLGTAAGAFGAFLIALLIFLVVGRIMPTGATRIDIGNAVLAITLGGLAGSVVDSALGYYEERGIGNKFTTNFICGICGGLVAIAIFLIL